MLAGRRQAEPLEAFDRADVAVGVDGVRPDEGLAAGPVRQAVGEGPGDRRRMPPHGHVLVDLVQAEALPVDMGDIAHRPELLGPGNQGADPGLGVAAEPLGHHGHLRKDPADLDGLRILRFRVLAVDPLQVAAKGLGETAPECPGALRRHRPAAGIGIGDLERSGQPDAFQVAGPPAATLVRAHVVVRVPRLSERQVVGGPVDQRTALERFEQAAELLLLLPHGFVFAAHDVDHLIVRPADVGAVQIERRGQPAVGPVRHERPQRSDRGVDALADVVPIVISRDAVLALVALLDAVFVHEGDRQDLDVPPEPVAVVVVGQNRLQRSLHDIVRHRLAGVMAGRQQDPVPRLAIQPADVQTFDAPPMFASCRVPGPRCPDCPCTPARNSLRFSS